MNTLFTVSILLIVLKLFGFLLMSWWAVLIPLVIWACIVGLILFGLARIFS